VTSFTKPVRPDGHRDVRAGVARSVHAASTLGAGLNGKRDVLGIRVAPTEGDKFWLSILTELKNRGGSTSSSKDVCPRASSCTECLTCSLPKASRRHHHSPWSRPHHSSCCSTRTARCRIKDECSGCRAGKINHRVLVTARNDLLPHVALPREVLRAVLATFVGSHLEPPRSLPRRWPPRPPIGSR
jgi:hypothetical protein